MLVLKIFLLLFFTHRMYNLSNVHPSYVRTTLYILASIKYLHRKLYYVTRSGKPSFHALSNILRNTILKYAVNF